MRALVIAAFTLALAVSPTMAHNDPSALGHHWEVAVYAREMRLQMIAIAAFLAIAGALSIAFRRRGRAGGG